MIHKPYHSNQRLRCWRKCRKSCSTPASASDKKAKSRQMEDRVMPTRLIDGDANWTTVAIIIVALIGCTYHNEARRGDWR